MKKINEGLKYLLKQCGPDAIMNLEDSLVSHPAISTGHPLVDAITGIGGLPRGKIVEIFGWESTGKSTLALQAVATEQLKGGVALYIDAEHAFAPPYAKRLGVDLSKEKFLVSQPMCGEEALRIAAAAIEAELVSMIVIDSTAALTPQAEIDGTMLEHSAGLGAQARMMSEAMRQLAGKCSKNDVCLIFINQIRNTIAKMGRGPSEKTTGGNALKFYASLRLELSRMGSIKGKLYDPIMRQEYEGVVGARIRAKVVKNKCASPFKVAEIILKMGQGFDVEGSIVDIAVAQGVVDKAGAWYSMDGERLGQGRDNTMKFLREHQELAQKITNKLDLSGGSNEFPQVVSMDLENGEETDIDSILNTKEDE